MGAIRKQWKQISYKDLQFFSLVMSYLSFEKKNLISLEKIICLEYLLAFKMEQIKFYCRSYWLSGSCWLELVLGGNSLKLIDSYLLILNYTRYVFKELSQISLNCYQYNKSHKMMMIKYTYRVLNLQLLIYRYWIFVLTLTRGKTGDCFCQLLIELLTYDSLSIYQNLLHRNVNFNKVINLLRQYQ